MRMSESGKKWTEIDRESSQSWVKFRRKAVEQEVCQCAETERENARRLRARDSREMNYLVLGFFVSVPVHQRHRKKLDRATRVV